MPAQNHDVCVAGVGIAGAFLLRSLKDLDVIGIDKRQKLGYPVECGEIVPTKDEMKILLPDLEDYSLFDIPRKYESNRTKYMSFITPDGREITVDFEMHVVERDEMITDIAEKSGHSIMKGERIIRYNPSKNEVELFGGKRIKAEVVAGCDGANSRISSALGFKRFTVPAKQYVMEGVECDEDVVYMYVGKRICPGGYAWIIPKGDGLANVGVGFVRAKGEKGDNAKKALERFVREYPHSSKFLRNSKVVSEIGAVVPVDLPLEKAVHGRTILLGDAAGMVISHVGAGIPTSMLAGDFAGKIINECFDRNDFSRLEKFDEMWKMAMLKAMLDSYYIKSLWDRISDSDSRLSRYMRLISEKDMWKILHSKVPLKLRVASAFIPFLNMLFR
ncbi:2,3-di-O-geranylgeranylglyceryl phosphate reductase [Archaeoglobus sulfaticallidus PM70-1]|uniref:2,3-di-O-geranylgeranylglyceryl phosphate reductase n=1 Tax=Archaeoglobus sulfaticallidus PM70-1 TaxID=387631 RepID=N0BE82_9EURY|nr:geranylgeranyl reductase family protein [Archaeoglobus sulfaticallidus]AGK61934.1 2,3-di-O-geranylgeranylglyceryl phosphate reductase [Archaeoglobus sulfaticallidus PM70-1]